jgi:hypothetical protein
VAEGGELRQGIDSCSLWLSTPGSANTAATENPRSGSIKNRQSSVHLTVSDCASSCQSLTGQAMIHAASPAGPRIVHVVAPVIKAALRQRRAALNMISVPSCRC